MILAIVTAYAAGVALGWLRDRALMRRRDRRFREVCAVLAELQCMGAR